VTGGRSGCPVARRSHHPQYLRPRGAASSVPDDAPSTSSLSLFSDRSAPPTRLGRRRHTALKPGVTPRESRRLWGSKGLSDSPTPNTSSPSCHCRASQPSTYPTHT